MASENIEKLLDKVQKDPASKLFVPLAEAYRKESMYEEAMEVLKKGIESQPTYMSARVALGKIYVEQGMNQEAKKEFQQVIDVIPDNLFAQRKLADLHKELGERDLAIRQYKAVVKLNPMDEEAQEILQKLQLGPDAEQESAPEALDEELTEILPAQNTAAEAAVAAEEVQELPEVQGKQDGPEVDGLAELSDAVAAAVSEEEDPADIAAAEAERELAEAVDGGFEMQLPQGGLDDDFLEELPVAGDEEFVTELPIAEPGELGIEVPEAEPEEPETEMPEAGGAEAELMGLSEARQEEAPAGTEMPGEGVPEVPESEALKLAAQYVEQGNYYRAMKLYGRVLREDPGDRAALQRLNELKSLTKMTGKDKEVLVQGLEAFLEALKKRKNEFFASP